MLLQGALVSCLCLMTVTATVAPGDEEQLCRALRMNGIAPIPNYDPNMAILMDSNNYQNLLPNRTGAVWQQVDNDVNNDPTVTTNWIQQSNSPCNQAVQVCGFTAGAQDNRLITQPINRTVNGTRLPRVSVLIEFEHQGCDITLNCQRGFNTHVYETSSVDSAAARNVNNYRQVRRVSPSVTDGRRVNETVDIDFTTDQSSFYFSIEDETSCIVVTRVIVFYTVCPAQTVDMISYPLTIAPVTGITTLTTTCVDNAEPVGEQPNIACSSDGGWNPLVSQCHCQPGAANVSGACIQCMAGTYSSPSSGNCSQCPANSFSDRDGLAECTCDPGYYRAPGEEDLPCRKIEIPVAAPTDIKAFCSNAVWRVPPEVSCSDILHYQLILRNPTLNQSMVRQANADGTFYVFSEEDDAPFLHHDTQLQVRIVTSSVIGVLSNPIPLGCSPTEVPQPNVYFELNGEMYLNNSKIAIDTVGENERALICKTDKEECCATRPNRFGEFYYPNGVLVPIRRAGDGFYRNRGNQLIRLNRRPGAVTPTGSYRCDIPDSSGVTQTIFASLVADAQE